MAKQITLDLDRVPPDKLLDVAVALAWIAATADQRARRALRETGVVVGKK